jgi:hypothetical protein
VKIAAIPQVLPSNRTAESVPSKPAGKFSRAFLWSAHAQSGFGAAIRRMQCDHKPMMRRKRFDLVCICECRFSDSAFAGRFRLADNRGGAEANGRLVGTFKLRVLSGVDNGGLPQ